MVKQKNKNKNKDKEKNKEKNKAEDKNKKESKPKKNQKSEDKNQNSSKKASLNDQPSKPQSAGSKSSAEKNSSLIVVLVIVIAVLLLVIIGIVVFVAIGKIKQSSQEEPSKLEEPSNQSEETDQEAKEKFTNQEYGFEFEIPEDWEGLKSKIDKSYNDYNAVSFDFFLPKDTLEDSDEIPGFSSIFSVVVFNEIDWLNFQRDFPEDEDYFEIEEILERRSGLVYVLYKDEFQKVPPGYSDFKQNLDAVIESFEAVNPLVDKVETDQAREDDYFAFYEGTELELENQLALFQDLAILFWSCTYNYALYYPPSWSNNADKYKAQNSFYGSGLTLDVRAFSNYKSLDDFNETRNYIHGGTVIDSVDIFKNQTRMIINEFSNPDGMVIYWQDGSNFMELHLHGPNYSSQQDTVINILASFRPNYSSSDCVASNRQPVQTFNCDNWVHPNGDVEYWWWEVSQAERDCFIERYGYDPMAGDYGQTDVPYCDYENDPDCWPEGEFEEGRGDAFDCESWVHPNGDITYWWCDLNSQQKDCYESRYDYRPDIDCD
ncbi:MAG: hypothetical protein GF347_01200 [Candidatus Moranbacteria bacterium]|nr:hypothetical protein [Candidatus Moranbacteria bacterium]